MPTTLGPRPTALLLCAAATAAAMVSAAPDLAAAAARKRDPVAAIDEWNASLAPADREAKYAKMLESPFVFFRGTNHLFWADVADDPRLAAFGGPSTATWLQGDMHPENVGAFDDDRGRVVYDLNDFDEAVIADYQYDVWRMACGVALVARANRPDDPEAPGAAARAFAAAYLAELARCRGTDAELEVLDAKAAPKPVKGFLKNLEADGSRKKMLKEFTSKHDGVRAFDLTLPKLGAPGPAERSAVEAAMPAYGRTLAGGLGWERDYFAVKSVARYLQAGTGSLGTRRLYVLVEGASDDQDDDRILDLKAQGRPTPYRFLSAAFRRWYDGAFASDAERHALAYRALTRHTDDHLGWMTVDRDLCSVRERSPFKEAFPSAELSGRDDLRALAEVWGAVVARAHARADRDAEDSLVPRSFEDEVGAATKGKEDAFVAQVRAVALEYADRVAADYRAFRSARGGGRRRR